MIVLWVFGVVDAVYGEFEGVIYMGEELLSILGMSSARRGQSSVMAGLQLASISRTFNYRSSKKSNPNISKHWCFCLRDSCPRVAFIVIVIIRFIYCMMRSYVLLWLWVARY